MKLLDKSQLNLAKVDKKFFPFFHVKNVLSIDFDPLDLVNDFPNIESGGSFPSDNLEEGNIKKLVQELEGDKFKAIAVVSDCAAKPCGPCRQIIYEYLGDIPIFLSNPKIDKIDKVTIKELLPYPFG